MYDLVWCPEIGDYVLLMDCEDCCIVGDGCDYSPIDDDGWW